VTVRSQVATVMDGVDPVGDYEYGLLLPTADPSVASYGPLPILPSATGQVTVAGWYAVYASAQTPTTVYAIQAPSPSAINISAGDNLDQDFTLEP